MENCAISSVTVTLWLRFTWDFFLSFLCLPLLLFLIPATKLSVKRCGKAGGWPIFLLYGGALWDRMFPLVACYSPPSCSRDLALFLSIPGSLVADWCVILIRSFCAASESISANGWSAVGGGSAEGSPSLSPEPSPLTAHLPAPLSVVCLSEICYSAVGADFWSVFLFFTLVFVGQPESALTPPPPPPPWWACGPVVSHLPGFHSGSPFMQMIPNRPDAPLHRSTFLPGLQLHFSPHFYLQSVL